MTRDEHHPRPHSVDGGEDRVVQRVHGVVQTVGALDAELVAQPPERHHRGPDEVVEVAVGEDADRTPALLDPPERVMESDLVGKGS